MARATLLYAVGTILMALAFAPEAFAQSTSGPLAPSNPSGGGSSTPTVPGGRPGDLGPSPSVPDLFGEPGKGFDRPGPQSDGAPAIPNEICVIFPPSSTPGLAQAFAQDLDLEVARDFTMQGLGLRVYLMRLGDGAEPDQVFEEAATDQRPLWVQPNYVYRTSEDGASAQNSQQYALHQMRADIAMSKTSGGAGIRIALIDSGVDLGHEALAGASIEGIDVVEEDSQLDPETHGTVLASILVGQGPLFGIAPKAHLIAIRAFREVDKKTGGAESTSFLLSLAIETAIRQQARVINLSLTGPQDRLVAQLVNAALMSRANVVAAAGNGGPKSPAAYPAAQDGVIAVTATDMQDRIYDQANRGDYISVAAPGVDILGARPGGTYDFFSGTSMATGYASGLAALLLSARSDLNVVKLRQTMEVSSVDLGPPQRDPQFGAGRIDAASALEALP
ncbi:S8 family serine peptidase [Dongia sp.]|uniref:S8 family serine peptidase n=1 Tax=Dongia sp. TaxID=1977262 RepID=UPI0035AFC70A